MKEEPPPSRSVDKLLSKRENDILVLLSQGLSDRQIAQSLTVAYSTVKWYNRQIFNKLGVDNREQAVERAKSLGLLGGDESVTPKHNLPASITPLVGRNRELEELAPLLGDSQVRLVTLLAPGGMGKTRLALGVAQLLLPDFADGVYFVPLAPISSSNQLVATIADALDFHFSPGNQEPKRQLLNFLRNKNLLLVLDNFEHLLDDATLVTEILQAATRIKVLVTSREKVNLTGEFVYPVTGLPCPEQGKEVDPLDYGAVQLFVQGAQRAQLGFILDKPTPVIRICQLVGGMPLAIELAAAWVDALSLQEIVQEISRSLDFLRTDLRDVPERLQSVRAVFESAWGRLTHEEQAVFCRLSVFRGGCTRDAARAVTGADVATLSRLVNKALLWHSANGRYEIHELLRQFAVEQLEFAGETEATQHDHAVYFAQYASTHGQALKGREQLEALRLIEADFDNIRQGFYRAGEERAAELVEQYADIWLFLDMRGQWQEGKQIFGQVIQQFSPEENRAMGLLLMGQSMFMYRLALWDESFALAENSVRIFRQCGRSEDPIRSLMLEAIALESLNEIERSQAFKLEAHQLALQYGDTWEKSTALFLLGVDALNHKEIDRGREIIELAYNEYRKSGDIWGATFPLRFLASLAFDAHDYRRAEALYREPLLLAQEYRYPSMITNGLAGLSKIARVEGRLNEAKEYLEQCLSIARDTGMVWPSTIAELGSIVSEIHDHQTAKSYFQESFETSELDKNNIEFVYLVLVMAESFAQTSAKDSAVELVSLLHHHPQRESLSLAELERADKVIHYLTNELSPDRFAAAWKRGESATIETLLQEILYSE
jgi:predicted ATPase/DNA-binding CsgD family transcriptional regulator